MYKKDPLCAQRTKPTGSVKKDLREWAKGMPEWVKTSFPAEPRLSELAPHPQPRQVRHKPVLLGGWGGFGSNVWAGGSAETPSGMGVDGRQLGPLAPTVPPQPIPSTTHISGSGGVFF